MLPPTPNPAGWLAQKLRVISDEPFEVRSFPIRPGDQVEASVWSPGSKQLIVDRIFGAEQVSPNEMVPKRELWALNLDGTGRLLDVNALAAAWSPDGHAIAYLHRTALHKYELWVVEWPQGAKRRLATTVGLRRPDWLGTNTLLFAKPDGSILGFDVATNGVREITTTCAWSRDLIQGISFALSPLGDWLVVRPQDQAAKLMLIPLNGQGSPRRIPSDPNESYDFIVGNMVWSSAGTLFAHTGYNSQARVEAIHVVDVHTMQEWDIPIDPSIGDGPRSLSWSPDSNVLAFVMRNERTRKTNLYVVNVDGSGLRNLSRDPNLYVRTPAWSPDGRYLFYSEYSDKDFTRRPRIMQVSSR